ncbi:TetR/AcrR family transcriptional regulator [Streptomyces stelliscabiei]|uniref:AcrR family transcriptional regulator n=1 Tax=Streptomyces stelliscabiei TaxID=146820 RepID=A0A8I0NZA0_9ACTN|nr:TetR-like C-terminal domain-containing protein [Streptomyces stelliscabiei]KND41851.1 TetR family transcriptional regulator [Streptomyces stelliscabiei]MBE1594549.1 AcrR family transcriptional regulator [Streptomyces stelliscabiei]MDX2518796.1 TetR-like C-terminal domain-containing protein [Streptomyces stelliscabiei]
MARLKTHDEALRLRLLHRAAATVFDRGAAALSLRQLVADAKTSATAGYSLFGSKAGLLGSLYQEAVSLFVERLGAVRPTSDPAGDVIRMGLAYREYAVANPHLYAILFSDRGEQCPSGAERPREVVESYRPLVDAVRRGQRAGRFGSASDPEVIALSVWGTAHGLVSLVLSGNEPPELAVADCYERALRRWWRGCGRARSRFRG